MKRRDFLSGIAAAGAATVSGVRPSKGAPETGAAFPLRVADDRRCLVDARSEPFFVLGDTPWFLQQLPMVDVRRIMDDRKAKGFNTLFLQVLDDSEMPSRDVHGRASFDPETDITRPVEEYWKYTDAVMDEAARRGFFVIMSDLWYGGGGDGLWAPHVTVENAPVYGRFLGKRYARFQNLMWMHCGDRDPTGHLAECARRLARAMKEEAPHQLHTAHVGSGHASARFFNGDPWLDVNMAYTYGLSYKHVLPEYERRDPVRPVILGETGYEGEDNGILQNPDARKGDLWTPYRIRRNVYWAVLSGACGYCAGTRLWRFEPNWRDYIDAESTRQAPLVLRLLGNRPWRRLVPDVKHELATAGFGASGQVDYATAARTGDGGLAMVYLPSPRELTVDLGRLRGQVAAHWFDPTNGASTAIAGGPFANRGSRAFSPPAANAAGEADFVLVLEAVG